MSMMSSVGNSSCGVLVRVASRNGGVEAVAFLGVWRGYDPIELAWIQVCDSSYVTCILILVIGFY